ncbi:hypothetical protein ACWGIV_32310 [Streptomyces sp. NPDC054844]
MEGDSPVGIPRAREVARTFADHFEPAPAVEAAETLALVMFERPPVRCGTAAAAPGCARTLTRTRCTSL